MIWERVLQFANLRYFSTKTKGSVSIATKYLPSMPNGISHRYQTAIKICFEFKYNIRFKSLLQQGKTEPIFYGDLVYKFKRIVGKPNFSDQFKKIIKHYKKVGYNLDVM